LLAIGEVFCEQISLACQVDKLEEPARLLSRPLFFLSG
jgi:hypothetical protein